MTSGGPTPTVPTDVRPLTLVLGGLRRGALLVFVPVYVIGQLLAVCAGIVTGWYGLSSWVRIGLAESLTSVRVAFDATATSGGTSQSAGQLVLATGALTIAVLVLAFRAGRAHAAGLEERPLAAAAAGSAVGLGFALPTFATSFAATVVIDRFGIDRLQPVRWQAFALSLIVAGAAAAAGALARARQGVDERIGERVVAAVAAGAAAFWWGLVLAFIAALVTAALSPTQVGTYARILDRGGAVGAAAIIQQALLVPNGSVLVLATSMGATTTVAVGADGAIAVTREGVHANGAAGQFVAAVLGANGTEIARFPWWFAGWLLVPLAATVIGGRIAAAGIARRSERVARGAASGLVYAALCAIAVWGASITIPGWGVGRSEVVTLGASPVIAGALALVWGLVGGAIGGAIPWPPALSRRERPR